QRLLLETAWEAMEDAGVLPASLAGSYTGAYVGVATTDYSHAQSKDPANLKAHTSSGDGRAGAGRLSQVFGWNGPAMSVDTACSSSLVAVHLACVAIENGECELAAAAGTNMVLRPEFGISFSQGGMLSPDGRCKAFDASANGFVRGEGVGLVLLKPLARAIADNNPIYAVIRGTAINNDGDTSPFMAPSVDGQVAVLEQAYRRAGLAPHRIQYVEAHGTGTKIGDPTEVKALNAVLGRGRSIEQPCLLGSSKTNIGHTEAAAGVAGLIKVALSIKHGIIPRTRNCENLNPEIPWADIPFTVLRERIAWPDGDGPRLAGVSSFGISGTNAHVVVEQPPAREEAALPVS
ncbi:MAG: polyketide synthase, partial [bacterium]|nr:polyketide synthase [bacterium]